MAKVSVKDAIKRLNHGGGPRPSGTIGGWPKEKRVDFEKDCVAKVLTVEQISEKYGVKSHTVRQYKYRYLSPALKTMAVKRKVELGESARGVLDWMLNENKDAIDELRGRKVDKETGLPIAPNPKVLGTLPDLLGKGYEGIRLLTEILGETNRPGAGQSLPTVITNVICVDKAPGTPEFEPDDEDDTPDYTRMKLIDIQADAE